KCHSPASWKSATLTKEVFVGLNIDHDKFAFKLTGKHQAVDCKSCHKGPTFKGTPQTCVSCHAEPMSHKPHPRSFGQNCADCHTTLTWKGTQLVKNHRVPLNHGNRKNGSRNNACVVCHKDTISLVSFPPEKTCPSYATHTCYGCHAH